MVSASIVMCGRVPWGVDDGALSMSDGCGCDVSSTLLTIVPIAYAAITTPSAAATFPTRCR
jgi:hypothetical protein